MTREEFGIAYQRHFSVTVRYMKSHGLSEDAAREVAQAAWTRGWERLAQLRDPGTLVIWLNTVALNTYRSLLRREPVFEELSRFETGTPLNLSAIDADNILARCTLRDRRMLREYYLDGFHLAEIAERNGWPTSTARVKLFRARQAARSSAGLTPHCPPRRRLLYGSAGPI